jgi:TonB family protein
MAYKAAIVLLLFTWCAGAASQEQSGPLNPPAHKESGERSAKFGDLVVTTTKMVTRSPLHARDQLIAAVFLTVSNSGNGVVCASFNTKLKTTLGNEYLGISGRAPGMYNLAPGASAPGNYSFEVKDGGQPLELILDLQGGTIRCKDSEDALPHDASVPNEIRLDVHGLPAPSASGPPFMGTLQRYVGGSRVVSYPSCIYCPSPQYTAKARHAKLEGTVVLKVVVGPDGNATNIEIVKGIGLGLDEEAVKAVQTWRFRPAVGPNGDPVATVTPIEMNFRLLK